MRRGWISISVVAALLSLTLLHGRVLAASGEQKMPERLVFFSLRPGTSVYASTVGLSQLVNQYTPYETIVQPYASSKARFSHLSKGTVDLSTATASNSYSYTYGIPIPVDPGVKTAYPGARILTGGNNLYFGWVTRTDTGIKTIADLKGHLVSGMVKGQGTMMIVAPDTLKAFGLDPEKDVKFLPSPSSTEGVKALIDGKIDATFSSLGGSKIQELVSVRGGRALPFPADKLKSVRVMPELFKVHMLPTGYLAPLMEPTPVIGTQNFLIGRENLPDEAAYRIVKAILEHYTELLTVSVEFKEWGKKQAVPSDFFLPYHPGAIKYFKEQGIWTADMDVHQKELLEKVGRLTRTGGR
ncbi:MAG: TAXI family TRAP transporter solute-binding subunit [Desulfobacterales bacterium]|nr:TAXI family TRAP transporter solute-binding subunit [Desulfobacterales bacterium]